MSHSGFLLALLVAASAVIYEIYTGRAEASRMRSLHQDILNGKLRGHLVILFVIVMFLGSSVF